MSLKIYGLATAPKDWKRTIITFLSTLGFKTSVYDDAVLVRHKPSFAVIITYVDDLLLLGDLAILVEQILTRFKCTPPRYLSKSSKSDPLVFLAHQMYLDHNGNFVMTINHYLETAITTLEFKGVLIEGSLTHTTTTLNPTLFDQTYLENGKSLTPHELTMLRSGIGVLNYACGLRLDLSAAVGILGQGQSAEKATDCHLSSLRDLISYVKYTQDRSLIWDIKKCQNPFHLCDVLIEGEFDASLPYTYARMCSVQRINGLTVSLRSKKQSTVSTSTTEAELVAGLFCARETLGQKNFVAELLPGANVTACLVGDNETANFLANSQCSLRRMKH